MEVDETRACLTQRKQIGETPPAGCSEWQSGVRIAIQEWDLKLDLISHTEIDHICIFLSRSLHMIIHRTLVALSSYTLKGLLDANSQTLKDDRSF